MDFINLGDNTPQRHSGGHKSASGSKQWVEVSRYKKTADFLAAKKREGVALAGACIGTNMTLEEVPVDRPICLVFGNEHKGLSDEIRAGCDFLYTIPMFGMVESFNLSVAASISLYEVTKRRRALLGAVGDLTAAEKFEDTARFYIQTIGRDSATKILSRLGNSKTI